MPLTLVTGGSRGIGAATCHRLALEGHDVVVGFHRDQDAAESVAQQVRRLGRQALAARVDVANASSVIDFFETSRSLGPMTGLVSNAGVVAGSGPLAEVSDVDLRRVVEVNLIGSMLCAREAIRRMPEGGAIVMVSSAAATLGSPGEFVHYAASKGAIDTLVVGLSKELGASGIRVNAVSPGLIHTDIHEPGRLQRLGPTVPLGRPGGPQEVAAAIAWLLSEDAAYVTGANLRVAGGR